MSAPDVYLFNPTCDFAVGNSSASWQANHILQKMEHDMANLPQFLCQPKDIVIVQNHPSQQLINLLTEAGFALPHFRKLNELGTANNFNRLCTWGWSPAAHQLLKPLKPLCSTVFLSSAVAEWKPEHRESYSRNTALQFLQTLLSEYKKPSFIGQECLPRKCKSIGEVEQWANQWKQLMVKLPWSSSGRGLQPVTNFPIHQSVRQRISGMLKNQGEVFVEPLLEKVFDLGFLYEVTSDDVKWLGPSLFFTDEKGQYKGNYLNGLPSDISDELNLFIKEVLEIIPSIHINLLNRAEIRKLYQGPVGIDTLIYRNIEGELKINPCLEINWRFTMGHVTLNLEQYLHKEVKAIFRTYYNNQKSFSIFARENIQNQPLKLSDGKIASGFIPLTEISEGSIFGAYLSVINSPGSPSF
jgi:hypothetical protein